MCFIHFSLFFLKSFLDGLQIGRVEAFLTGIELLLIFESEDLFAAPFGLTPFTHLTIHLSLLLHLLDVDLLYLEFDAAKLDNVVLFQRVRLLDISILDIPDNKIDLLACVTRVLQLFTRFSILQIHVFAHEILLLCFSHGFESFDFNRLNPVVVPYFANV